MAVSKYLLEEYRLLKTFSSIGMAAWLLQISQYKTDINLSLGTTIEVNKKIISKDLVNIIANMIVSFR